MASFGDKIKTLRLQRNFSQSYVARQLNMSQTGLSSYEVGRNEPSFSTVEKFASFYNVSPLSLMPFDTENGEDVIEIADSLGRNPKLRLLFDRSRALSDSDLNAVLAIVSAIRGEHHE